MALNTSLKGLFSVSVDELPFTVIVKALGELSTKVLDWQVSNDVPDMAVSGAVGGVKFAV